nr:hypothetical protein [uncultured Blautia sp.]
MKRSMAWIMTAAVVMTAAPVSAADFSSEADAEVSAETAEVNEENNLTDANMGEDSSDSIDITMDNENNTDHQEVTIENNTEDSDDAESTFSDGKEATAQDTDNEGFTDNGNMTAEELAEAFATGDANVEDDAPWSGVDSLPAGTYENVTANLYVPGAQNKILGVNAYLNNPADPTGMSGVFGTPTEPMYNEASMVVNENGKITLTIELKNQVFELLQVKDGKNIHVKEVERSDTWAYDNVDKVDMGDGTFKGRITKIVFELDDFSGLYTLGDCVEFGIILYDEQNPDKDVKWYVPLNLAVDFEEQKPDVNISNKAFFNDDARVGIAARGRDMDKVVADIHEVTSGEEFDKVDTFMKENCAEQPNYKLYYFSLNRTDGKDISESKLKYSFFKSVFHEINNNSAQVYQWQGNSLSEMKNEGNTTREYWNGQDGDIWEAVTIYEGLKFGYVIICDKNSNVKCQRTFTDESTGISAIYHGFNNSDNCNENMLTTNTEFVVRKNDVSNPDELKQMILESGQSSFKQLKIEDSYRLALYRRSGDSKTLGAQKNITYTDILFPKNLVENQNIYKVVYDRDAKQYVSVEKMEIVEEGENIKVNAVDITLSNGNQFKQMQLYYSAIDENYVGSRSKSQCQFFVFVGEGAAADKPSVPTSAFTYDATEKVVVPESKYYTVEGTSSAKLPGSYKVTVTLKDGYAWKDGTTDPIEFTWNIKALQTKKPVAVSGLAYNGKNQTGVKAGKGYNLAGTYTAKNVGSYKAKVLLAEGYEWSDGTTDPLTLTWSINKAGQTVKTKVTTKNYTFTNLKKKAASFAIGASGQGTISYKVVKAPSKASKYITVDKKGKVTVKKGAKIGTYVVRVSAAGNSNYKAATKDVTVKVTKLTQKITAKVSKKNVKASSIKKKAVSFNIGAKAKTSVFYKVVKAPSKASKYISVSKSGKVTMKKKAPKGTYEIRVTAKANGTYNAATKTIKVVVK